MTADDQVGNPSEDTPGFDQYYGNGRINAYRALYGAPCKPWKPQGSTNGKVGVSYTYITVSHDPNEDDLWYKWDWGDGTNSEWMGAYTSGQEVSASHTWTEDGSCDIKVKAKDTDNKESEWLDPLNVKMPRSKKITNTFYLDLFFRFTSLLQFIKLLIK